MDDDERSELPEPVGIRRVPPLTPTPIHERHVLMRLPRSAQPREVNTIVLPGVDLDRDLADVMRGDCWYDSATRRIWVNGRLYGQHDDGQLYPMQGIGLVQIDRQTFRALRTFRRYNGLTERALFEIERDPYITDDQRDRAIRLWRVREDRERNGP